MINLGLPPKTGSSLVYRLGYNQRLVQKLYCGFIKTDISTKLVQDKLIFVFLINFEKEDYSQSKSETLDDQ